MARYIDSIKNDPETNIMVAGKEKWVISKEIIPPLNWRIRDAWGVLIGKYEAFKFHEEDK